MRRNEYTVCGERICKDRLGIVFVNSECTDYTFELWHSPDGLEAGLDVIKGEYQQKIRKPDEISLAAACVVTEIANVSQNAKLVFDAMETLKSSLT